VPLPPKTGACWGCPKAATNACECFERADWSGGGPSGRRRPQEMGAPTVGPPALPNSRPRRYGAPTPQKRCVLGVLQRGHKRM